MLFRRNIVPCCSYCRYGMSVGLGEVACKKRGIMFDDGSCTSFRYEPTKRKPEYPGSPVAVSVSQEDMSL